MPGRWLHWRLPLGRPLIFFGVLPAREKGRHPSPCWGTTPTTTTARYLTALLVVAVEDSGKFLYCFSSPPSQLFFR